MYTVKFVPREVTYKDIVNDPDIIHSKFISACNELGLKFQYQNFGREVVYKELENVLLDRDGNLNGLLGKMLYPIELSEGRNIFLKKFSGFSELRKRKGQKVEVEWDGLIFNGKLDEIVPSERDNFIYINLADVVTKGDYTMENYTLHESRYLSDYYSKLKRVRNERGEVICESLAIPLKNYGILSEFFKSLEKSSKPEKRAICSQDKFEILELEKQPQKPRAN